MSISTINSYIFIVAIGLFASVADLALGRAGLMPIQPTYLALATLVGLAAFEALLSYQNPTEQRIRLQVVKENTPVLLLYCVVAFTSLLCGLLPGAEWTEGGRWMFVISLGMVLWTATMFIAASPAFSTAGMRGVRLAWAALIGSTIYEMFYPATFSNLAARPAGFAGNANFGALASSMLCAASLYYRPRTHLLPDIAMLSLSFISVLATQSRSGLLELGIVASAWFAILIFELRNSPLVLVKTLVAMTCSGAVLAVSLVVVFTQSEVFSNESSRFAKILSGKQVDDGSGDERISAAADTLERIAESPVLGHGTGFSRNLRTLPHNIYLQQWLNNGLLGVLGYTSMLICGAVLSARARFIPGLVFSVMTLVAGFFSHNILDQKSFILPFAVLLASSAVQSAHRRSGGTSI